MTLPPYGSLHLARCAMEAKFPTHTGKLKKGSPAHASTFQALQDKQKQLRTLTLEIAKLEVDLKESIGYNEGLEIPGGVLYWSTVKSPKRTRINWMRLVQDHKISEETLKGYVQHDGKRRFFFRRRLTGSDTLISNTQNQDNALDDDI